MKDDKLYRAKIYFYDDSIRDYRLVPLYYFVGIIGIYKDTYFEIGANKITSLIIKEISRIKPKGRLKRKQKNGEQKQ